jgi:hypothetical protein
VESHNDSSSHETPVSGGGRRVDEFYDETITSLNETEGFFPNFPGPALAKLLANPS